MLQQVRKCDLSCADTVISGDHPRCQQVLPVYSKGEELCHNLGGPSERDGIVRCLRLSHYAACRVSQLGVHAARSWEAQPARTATDRV